MPRHTRKGTAGEEKVALRRLDWDDFLRRLWGTGTEAHDGGLYQTRSDLLTLTSHHDVRCPLGKEKANSADTL